MNGFRRSYPMKEIELSLISQEKRKFEMGVVRNLVHHPSVRGT